MAERKVVASVTIDALEDGSCDITGNASVVLMMGFAELLRKHAIDTLDGARIAEQIAAAQREGQLVVPSRRLT